jgi:pilus assembly protein Flp/PilA
MVKLYVTLMSLVSDHTARLRSDDDGATAVEYGLMVALIAAVIIGTVATLGGKLDALFQNVTGALP